MDWKKILEVTKLAAAWTKIKSWWVVAAKFLPFNNPPVAVALIVGLILGFVSMRACEGAETMLEGGAAVLSGEYSEAQYLVLEERFVEGRYGIGLIIIGDQICKCREGDVFVETNMGAYVTRNVFWKRLEIGIGLMKWQNTNRALSKDFTFHLTVAINLWRELDLRFGHDSNAGTGSPNVGQDTIGLSWRFQ